MSDIDEINKLLAMIQVRSEMIGYLRTDNHRDLERIKLIEGKGGKDENK